MFQVVDSFNGWKGTLYQYPEQALADRDKRNRQQIKDGYWGTKKVYQVETGCEVVWCNDQAKILTGDNNEIYGE